MSYNNKAIRLAAILDRIDEEGVSLAAETFDPFLAQEKRRAVLRKEADDRLEMDMYLRTIAEIEGVRWKLMQAIGTLEDAINDKYPLSDAELNMFAEDLADLIDAGIPGLTVPAVDGYRNTARIILRVIYNDDWKKFLDDMVEKLDIGIKS